MTNKLQVTEKTLREAGACEPGLDWWRKYKHTPDWESRVAVEYPEWYLWCAGHGFEGFDEYVVVCAKEKPYTALCFAKHLLPPEVLAACQKDCRFGRGIGKKRN